MRSKDPYYQSLALFVMMFLWQTAIAQNSANNIPQLSRNPDTINVKWFGAKGDNLHNDSAAFETAIKYTAAKRKVLLVPKGQYQVSNLLVYANCTIVGSNGASVLILNDGTQSNRQCLLLTSISQNVTLKGLGFDANGKNNAGKNIFCIKTQLGLKDGINGFTIRNCSFTGSKNYGVLFLIGATDRITNTKITACKFYNVGSAAVSVRGVNGFVFANNSISAWSRLDKSNSAFQFQSQQCSNILFTKNTFKNADAAYFAVECAGTRVVNGKFTGNVFDGNGYDASGISGCYSNCLFKGNRHLNGGGSHRSGYEIVGDNDTITNNTIEKGSISLGTGVPGVAFSRGGSNYIVTENKVSANSGSNNNCLSIGGVDTVKGALIANNIFDNSMGKGNAPVIALGQRGAAVDVVIKNNTLTCAPGNACIRMKVAAGNVYSANITITKNQLTGENGIQVYDTRAWKNVNISGNDLRHISKAAFTKDADFTPDFHINANTMK